MTNEQRAHKKAANESKTGEVRFVVYVFDEGYQVVNSAQQKTWGAFTFLEATYISGVKVDSLEVAA